MDSLDLTKIFEDNNFEALDAQIKEIWSTQGTQNTSPAYSLLTSCSNNNNIINNNVKNSEILPFRQEKNENVQDQAATCVKILQELLNLENNDIDNPKEAQRTRLIRWLQEILLSNFLNNSHSSPYQGGQGLIKNLSLLSSISELTSPTSFGRCSESLGSNETKFTWSGEIPMPMYFENASYSCKVFLGGLPWDITDQALSYSFRTFGNILIEWPGKHGGPQPKGYAYIIFENENQVKSLLQSCTKDFRKEGSLFYKISSRRMKLKEVQVIPWSLLDTNYYTFSATPKLDGKRTIFVGALHGMLNANGLGKIMDELFGGVIYAGIDTDKYKYPIGSARVTFNNMLSYKKAVSAEFVEIKTPKFAKKVQLDPYLEDSVCSNCLLQVGPYFCRKCLDYFCKTCFMYRHMGEEFQSHHTLVKNSSRTGNHNGNGNVNGNNISNINNGNPNPMAATNPMATNPMATNSPFRSSVFCLL